MRFFWGVNKCPTLIDPLIPKSWGSPKKGGISDFRSPIKKVAGVGVGLGGVDGVPMGCGWGADEAGLRARGGPMLRGFVDALDR